MKMNKKLRMNLSEVSYVTLPAIRYRRIQNPFLIVWRAFYYSYREYSYSTAKLNIFYSTIK